MRGIKAVVLQIVVLVALAAAVGLAANQVRWDKNSISLTRNYFLGRSTPAVQGTPDADPGAEEPATGGPAATDTDAQADAPPEHEFEVINFDQLQELVESDSFLNGMSIIIDARDDEHFMEGHIPQAYQLDYYRVDDYMPVLEPIVLGLDRIVVYCNGGKCEDSLLAARYLVEFGVSMDKICLYEGGIKEWIEKGGPIEQAQESRG